MVQLHAAKMHSVSPAHLLDNNAWSKQIHSLSRYRTLFTLAKERPWINQAPLTGPYRQTIKYSILFQSSEVFLPS